MRDTGVNVIRASSDLTCENANATIDLFDVMKARDHDMKYQTISLLIVYTVSSIWRV